MALAFKRGKPLSEFPEGAREGIRQMAQMSEDKLRDFARKGRRGSVMTGRDS